MTICACCPPSAPIHRLIEEAKRPIQLGKRRITVEEAKAALAVLKALGMIP